MKKGFFFLFVLVAALAAQGQRFDWVKGYDSGFEDSYIKGTVTDSHGNLYILGQFHYDSDWEGGVNPLCGQITTQNTMVIVAKISPEGEMVWKKMFGRTDNSTIADDIKPLGDTGFAVVFEDGPCSVRQYRYWIDTVYDYWVSVYDPPTNLITHPLLENIPNSAYGYGFSDNGFSVYMSFDFDGNITEQHIINMSYVDSDGNNLVAPFSTPALWMTFSDKLTFDFDTMGNIYLCRQAYDYAPHFVQYNGTISRVRYWVDHRLAGESVIENNPSLWYPQLLKFSPHFDTLLASRYIVQASNSATDSISGIWPRWNLKCDKSTGKLYVRTYVEYNACHAEEEEEIVVIDSTSNMTVRFPKKCYYRNFITVHNPDLTLCHLIQIEDSVLDTSGYYANTGLLDITFDNDSNLVAINGASGMHNAVFTYNGNPLPLNNKAFVMLLDKFDYHLHSIMMFPSMANSNIPINQGYGNLVLKNNRVFLQGKYKQGVRFPSGFSFVTGGSDKTGLALAIFDYQGNLIDGMDYKTYSKYHYPGPIALVDSTLYLMNLLLANATFGEQTVYVYSGCYYSSIAKYVDTSFMSVYKRPLPGAVDVAKLSDISYYPNPVADILHVALDEDIVLHANAISILGQSILVDVKGNEIDVTNLSPGFYTLKIATFKNKTYNLNIIKQ